MAAQTFCINDICRVCAEGGCGQFIPIFEHPGLELSLSSKIEAHLPIKVQLSDNLPHQVCEPCICKLNICHELVQIAKAADLKLRHLLNNSSDSVCEKPSRSQDNLVQCNEIHVTQFDLPNENISVAKPFEISDERDEKILGVEFEIAIADNIAIVKNIGGDQQLQVSDENSNVASTDVVFELADTNVNDKLTNLMHNEEHFSLNSVYESQVNEENHKDSSDNVEEQSKESIKSSTSDNNDVTIIKFENNDEFVGEEPPAKINDNPKRNSCPHCGKVCKSSIGLDVHISTHSKVAPFLCDLCGKKFKHINSLYCHKRTHLDESQKKKHLCDICSKTFRSKFHLSEHMNIHNGVKPHECTKCGKFFHKRIHLRQHASTHVSEKDKLVCATCGSTFGRRSNLLVHIRKCHGENRIYKCRICPSQFPKLNQLLSHRSVHSQQTRIQQNSTPENNYPCHICGNVLGKKKSLEVHLLSHSGGNKCWCDVCGKELSSKASLRYHYKSLHCTERSWHCQYCGKGYMSQELQLIHERSHTGIRPYKCAECNKTFISSNSLNQHMQRHSDERNFHCIYCPKTFQRKSSLTVHIRTHTGEKPYVCDVCGHGFVQKNDMIKHLKTHRPKASKKKSRLNDSSTDNNMEEQHPCESCTSVFQTKSELSEHRLMVHGITIPVVFSSQNGDVLTSIAEIITDDVQDIIISNVSSIK